VVGDSRHDLEAAVQVGALPILVRTGKGQLTIAHGRLAQVPVFDDLAAVTTALLDGELAVSAMSMDRPEVKPPRSGYSSGARAY